MCPYEKSNAKIDVEELRKITKNAEATKKTEDNQAVLDAKANRILDADKLFNSIVEDLPTKMAEAAAKGKKSIVVWRMGDFGYCNSDEVPESTPIDWVLFERLEKYCKDNHLETERETKDHHEYGHNFFSQEHIYYVLTAKWL